MMVLRRAVSTARESSVSFDSSRETGSSRYRIAKGDTTIKKIRHQLLMRLERDFFRTYHSGKPTTAPTWTDLQRKSQMLRSS